jgi:hypothetical protein
MTKKTSLLRLIDDIYAAEKAGIIRDVRHLSAGLNTQYVRFTPNRPLSPQIAQTLTTYLETQCESIKDTTVSTFDVLILYTLNRP